MIDFLLLIAGIVLFAVYLIDICNVTTEWNLMLSGVFISLIITISDRIGYTRGVKDIIKECKTQKEGDKE